MSQETQSLENPTPHPFWVFLTGRHEGEAGDHARLKPKPFWNPYVAGVLLGVTLFAAFFVMGRGLGASGSLNRLTAFFYSLFSVEFAGSLAYYRGYFAGEGSLLAHYAIFQTLGVFLGGYVSASLGRRARLEVAQGPRSDTRSRLLWAFFGGFVMAWGARIARGCTSGQVLTGSANLALGSLIMFVCFFLGAYLMAYMVRKQWIH